MGRPGMRRRFIATAMALALAVAGCAGPDVSPYVVAVDGLVLPTTWQVTKTVSRGTGGNAGCVQLADPMCPSVTRYYSAPGPLPDLYQDARSDVLAAGFGDLVDSHPECDLETNAARCSMAATHGEVRIEIYLFPDGQDVDAFGVSVPGQATVRVIARHS